MNRQDAKNAKKGSAEEPASEIDNLARMVIGAALEVHRVLGPGFLESVYEEALCLELGARAIPFRRQVPIGVLYKGHMVGQSRLDLLVADQLIVELKAVESLDAVHLAQVLSYLKTTHLRVGLLFNFNVPELRRGMRRIIRSS